MDFTSPPYQTRHPHGIAHTQAESNLIENEVHSRFIDKTGFPPSSSGTRTRWVCQQPISCPKKRGWSETTILAKTNDTRRIIVNARLYAPSPLAMFPELRKPAVLLANSSGNNLTPIYYSVQPTLSGGKGDLQHFTRLLKVFH